MKAVVISDLGLALIPEGHEYLYPLALMQGLEPIITRVFPSVDGAEDSLRPLFELPPEIWLALGVSESSLQVNSEVSEAMGGTPAILSITLAEGYTPEAVEVLLENHLSGDHWVVFFKNEEGAFLGWRALNCEEALKRRIEAAEAARVQEFEEAKASEDPAIKVDCLVYFSAMG